MSRGIGLRRSPCLSASQRSRQYGMLPITVSRVDPALDLVLERGSKPLHVTIAEQLAATIASGTLAPGMRLPPERQLAESLGVSRMTVRQALGDLERDGLLRRVVGRAGGTFVCEPERGAAAGARRRRASRPSCAARAARRASSRSRPRSSRPAGASPPRSSSSGRTKVVVITRLRLAGGKPLAIERTSLPARALLGHRGHGSRAARSTT